MRKYLLPECGNFYKANMHMHTTVSDGKFTPEETKKAYMEMGYSIVAFTDHELMLPHPELRDDNFLPITSHEISVDDKDSGKYEFKHTYHLNLYSRNPDETRMPLFNDKCFWPARMRCCLTKENTVFETSRVYSTDGVNELIRLAKERGFIVCYNHHSWSQQTYNDYIGLNGLWGAECYNTGCVRGGYPLDDDIIVIDDFLRAGKQVFPIASDDSHNEHDRFGGYIMVKAGSLDYDSVFAALERGDFYASTGPEIETLYIEDGKLHIDCHKAREVYVTTERRAAWIRKAPGRGSDISADIDLNDYIEISASDENDSNGSFIRVTVKGHDGSHAYTRGYFVDELK